MPTLPKSVAHEYDPKLVFRSHSTNLPHLNSWIDELISLNESSLPAQSHPTTDSLVESLQRYDAVFRELLRQTSIFSEPVTKLLAKVWAGVLKLLDYMIKSYHRYVKHTSHLQTQAQNLLQERQGQAAAEKIKNEEFDLERTSLRARIRNLESELEAVKMSKRGMEKENIRLRRIIEVYIHSNNLNNPVWELLDEDEHSKGPDGGSNGVVSADGDDLLGMQSDSKELLGFRKQVQRDSGENPLRILNRLDIEMNEILANTLREENRQRLLMQDISKLIERHHNFFSSMGKDETDTNAGEGKVQNSQSDKSKSIIKSDETLKKLGFVEHKEFCTAGMQTDEKDEFGLVDNLPQNPILENLGPPPLPPINAKLPGENYPFQLRKVMSSFPFVLRVPPAAWICQQIMAIYLEKIQDDEERMAMGIAKLSLPLHVYNYFLKHFGLSAAADVQVALMLKACEVHVRSLPRVALYVSQLGLFDKEKPPPLDVRDTDFILHFLKELIRNGELVQDHGKKSIVKRVNVIKPEVSRVAAANAISSIFEKWLPDKGEEFVIKVKSVNNGDKGSKYIDLDFVLDMLMEPWTNIRLQWEEHARYLFHEFCGVYKVLQEVTFANDEGVKPSDAILGEVHKASAMDCIRRPMRTFQKGETKEEDSTGKSGQDQKKPKVVVGNPNKEPVCEAMNKKSFINVMHTINPSMPMKKIDRIFEEALDIAHERVLRSLEQIWLKCLDTSHGAGGKGAKSKDANGIEHHEVTQETNQVLVEIGGSLNKSKKRNANANREYYTNLRNSQTQWTKPYYPKIFRAQDIELDVFVSIVLRSDVFAHSPLLEYMHIPPKDLWQNADMFHKQVQEARNQEALAKLLSKEGLELNPDSRPGSEDGRSDNRPHSKKKTKKRATTSKSGTKSIIASVATIDLMQPTVNSN